MTQFRPYRVHPLPLMGGHHSGVQECPTYNERLSLEGHGGGDYGLIQAFVKAVAEKNPGLILSGPEETLESHLMVFAAEQSRLKKKTILL